MKKRRRWLRRLAFALGGIIVVILVAVIGVNIYLQVSEHFDRSGRVYVMVHGKRQYLDQSQRLVEPLPAVSSSPSAPSSSAISDPPVREGTATATGSPNPTPSDTHVTAQATPLPPLQLSIPDIDVNVPIVLADNQNLPRVRVAGWFFKSAFPGTAGNMVLLGHLDGPAQTFGRLSELRAGDVIRVGTAKNAYEYTVDSSETVPSNDVKVLAPTSAPIVTLITCAGDWNPNTKTYDERLVVRGHFSNVIQGEVTP